MKIPYIQITFLLVAIALAFTPFWEWTSAILVTLFAYRADKKNKNTHVNPMDRFV